MGIKLKNTDQHRDSQVGNLSDCKLTVTEPSWNTLSIADIPDRRVLTLLPRLTVYKGVLGLSELLLMASYTLI